MHLMSSPRDTKRTSAVSVLFISSTKWNLILLLCSRFLLLSKENVLVPCIEAQRTGTISIFGLGVDEKHYNLDVFMYVLTFPV